MNTPKRIWLDDRFNWLHKKPDGCESVEYRPAPWVAFEPEVAE